MENMNEVVKKFMGRGGLEEMKVEMSSFARKVSSYGGDPRDLHGAGKVFGKLLSKFGMPKSAVVQWCEGVVDGGKG